MSKENIYGKYTGTDGAGDAIKDAMSDLKSSFSNSINSKVADSRVNSADTDGVAEGEGSR